jgi:hypothetical protein
MVSMVGDREKIALLISNGGTARYTIPTHGISLEGNNIPNASV